MTPSVVINRTSAGFSLIELMVAMVVVMNILGMMAAFISMLNQQLRTQRPRMAATANAQMAMDTMTRLIRMASSRPFSCDPAFQLLAPTPSVSLANNYYAKLRIQADWDPADCALTGVEEDVTFSVSDNVFYADAAQSVPYAESISALRFKFFDENNQLMVSPESQGGQIAYIQIELDTEPVNGFSKTITSGVTIR
jgi:type II secretory pathway component PulJ